MENAKIFDVVVDKIAETLFGELEVPAISRDSRLVEDIGLESLDMVTLIMDLEEAFERDIPQDDPAVENIKTVGEMTDYIAGRLSAE